jgi:hypothetical protein
VTADSDEGILRRLQRIEDIQEIQKLKARYCHYADTGWEGSGSDPNAVAEVFSEDAIYETGPGGTLRGREAIRGVLTNPNMALKLALHLALNPVIEVDGDRATGSWRALNALTGPDGTQALWSGGRYEEEYVRTPEGWRISFMRRYLAFFTPYEEGWGKVPRARLNPPPKPDQG